MMHDRDKGTERAVSANIDRRTFGLAIATVGAMLATEGANARTPKPRQPQQQHQNAVLGPASGLHHVGLMTADFEASLRFYIDGLGFAKRFSYYDPKPFRTVFLDSGNGITIELFDAPEYTPKRSSDAEIPLTNRPLSEWRPFLASRGGQFHFALRTTRLNAAAENACKHGGRIVVPPISSDLVSYEGEGALPTRWAYVEGPSGEWVELLEIGELPPVKR